MRDSVTQASSWVRLLDLDPDLAVGMDALATDEAARASAVGTWALEPGRWQTVPEMHDDLALYVIAGGLARRVRVGEQQSVEVLGPGQVLRPGAVSPMEMIPAQASWQVLSPSWLAILDHTFWGRMAGHPQVVLALFDRMVLRSRSLAMRLAIVGVRNLPRRLLVVLWHLADSYGRVGRDGVMVDLSLSHDMLSHLVSARRSSVSKAVKDLEQEGVVSRAPQKRFVLHGEPPVLAEGPVSPLDSSLPAVAAIR